MQRDLAAGLVVTGKRARGGAAGQLGEQRRGFVHLVAARCGSRGRPHAPACSQAVPVRWSSSWSPLMKPGSPLI